MKMTKKQLEALLADMNENNIDTIDICGYADVDYTVFEIDIDYVDENNHFIKTFIELT